MGASQKMVNGRLPGGRLLQLVHDRIVMHGVYQQQSKVQFSSLPNIHACSLLAAQLKVQFMHVVYWQQS